MAEQTSARVITPRRVIVAFIVVVVVGTLLTPSGLPESGGRLTSHAYDAGGVRGFYEAAARLGWPVTRIEDRFQGILDTNAIYVVLHPTVQPTSREASALLTAVRSGAGMLLVAGSGSALADSLGLKEVTTNTLGPYAVARRAAWDSLGAWPTPMWPFGVIERTDSAPDNVVVFLEAVRLRANMVTDTQAVVVGVPLGKGRIAMIADGAVLANRNFRASTASVLPIRLLEWLAPDRKPTLVFAEYHQGYGRHPSVTRAIRTALFGTPVGRAALQVLAAAGVLLLVHAIRPIAPRGVARVERRSPIEHVGALAHAYAQVGATRIAIRRLVRGLRRRHPIGILRAATDEEYLASVAARHPSVALQIELLAAATSERQTPERFREAGAAVAHIERKLST